MLWPISSQRNEPTGMHWSTAHICLCSEHNNVQNLVHFPPKHSDWMNVSDYVEILCVKRPKNFLRTTAEIAEHLSTYCKAFTFIKFPDAATTISCISPGWYLAVWNGKICLQSYDHPPMMKRLVNITLLKTNFRYLGYHLQHVGTNKPPCSAEDTIKWFSQFFLLLFLNSPFRVGEWKEISELYSYYRYFLYLYTTMVR